MALAAPSQSCLSERAKAAHSLADLRDGNGTAPVTVVTFIESGRSGVLASLVSWLGVHVFVCAVHYVSAAGPAE